MYHVLFVDDERNVLDGLRRTFRSFRQEWDMSFAGSGLEALSMMAERPVDVLITDMRMPGMSGDELLSVVRNKYPSTVRIVLTGQCTRESMLRLIPLAHRVFSKPCDPNELKAAVSRAISLQTLLQCPSLIALIGQMESLPTPSALHTKILEEVGKPDGSLVDVGELISQDIGLASKLMQVANSAWVALRCPTSNPIHAVQVLGIETTKAIVLTCEVFNCYDPTPLVPYSIEDIWSHSCAVGLLAEKICNLEGDAKGFSEARLAGLLHDVGRLALGSRMPATYKNVLQKVHEEKIPLIEAERKQFGVTHADIGAYLLGLWGLPCSIVETVAWHHTPLLCSERSFSILAAIHAAESILGNEEADPPVEAYFEKIGLENRLPQYFKLAESLGLTVRKQ